MAYALSPVDLIPDFIPVLALLNDLVLSPLGILLVKRMIPAEVLAECREQAPTIPKSVC
ncbi:MAG: YkvA family protein [Rubrobacter sp.]